MAAAASHHQQQHYEDDEEYEVVLLGVPGKQLKITTNSAHTQHQHDNKEEDDDDTKEGGGGGGEASHSLLAQQGHTAYESWIGGEAMDFRGQLVTDYCGVCKKPLFNVCQLYAPFNGPRALAVLGCNEPSCCRHQKANTCRWKALRFVDDGSSEKTEERDDAVTDTHEPSAEDAPEEKIHDTTSGAKPDGEEEDTDELSGLFSAALSVSSNKSKNAKGRKHNKGKKTPKHQDSGRTGKSNLFPCYFLNIKEEYPDEDGDDTQRTDEHVEELYQRYLKEAREEEGDEDVDWLPETIHSRRSMKHHAKDADEDDHEDDEENSGTAKVEQLRFHYRQQVSKEPSQVVRYQWDGKPLWPYSPPKKIDIPRCPCGYPRKFEFQVLPSALHYLNPESVTSGKAEHSEGAGAHADPSKEKFGGMDWNSLCVYSCSHSCNKSSEECVLVV